jgi:hypothetical protein
MGGVAWDFALRFLLPEGVDGIIVEVESNFNHTRSYRISGRDAFFLGDDAQHQPKYDHMKVMRSLLPPNARANNTQYQVCEYDIVSNFDTLFYNALNTPHTHVLTLLLYPLENLPKLGI